MGGVGGWGGRGDERAFIFIPLRFLLKRVCSDRKEFALKRFRPNEINLIPPGPPPPPSVVFLLTVPKQFIYYSSSSSVIASLPLYLVVVICSLSLLLSVLRDCVLS